MVSTPDLQNCNFPAADVLAAWDQQSFQGHHSVVRSRTCWHHSHTIQGIVIHNNVFTCRKITLLVIVPGCYLQKCKLLKSVNHCEIRYKSLKITGMSFSSAKVPTGYSNKNRNNKKKTERDRGPLSPALSSASLWHKVASMEVTGRMLGEQKKNKWNKSWAEEANNLRKKLILIYSNHCWPNKLKFFSLVLILLVTLSIRTTIVKYCGLFFYYIS